MKVEAVGNVKAQTLLASTVKLVRRGSVVYTDRYRVYDALMFCGYRHLRVDHDRRFSRGKVHINGLEGFWAYGKSARRRLQSPTPRRPFGSFAVS